MKKKEIIIILIIFVIVLSIIGGTFAYFNWQTSEAQQTNVTFKVTQNFSCAADGGGNITSADVSLAPASCTNSTHAIKRTVTVKPTNNMSDMNITMSLWLNVNTLGTGLSNSKNFRYALTTSDTSCETGVVSTGTFNGKTVGSKVNILEENFSTSTTKTYYLYIWLDKLETSSSTMDQNFSLSIGGDCTNNVETKSEPAAPVLDDGMIPVVISDTGEVTTVSKDDSSWYNYNNKEWANAVLVKSSGVKTREENKVAGTVIDSSDILAYYVWIPRHSYKMNGHATTISIVFNETPTGYTEHPAFWWDSDNDGVVDSNERLAGIWVGKFQTSKGTSSNVGTSNPTILPNVQSWRSQNVSTQFKTSLKFSGGTLTDGIVTFAGNDTYGLTNKTNSHMMKNSEWGAVAYLSHSIYGANREIYINNSSSCYTGRSGGNAPGSTATNTVYTNQTSTSQYNSYGFYTWDGYLLNYNTNTKSATHDITKVSSTTGNITGIYDMSGGGFEYVMGVLADSNGNPRSGKDSNNNSGFNGLLENETPYTLGISFPTSNYYDLYTSTNPSSTNMLLSTTACKGEICYGHALSETANWYSDYTSFVYSTRSWFYRGGAFSHGSGAGAFMSGNYYGNADGGFSWRSVLVTG